MCNYFLFSWSDNSDQEDNGEGSQTNPQTKDLCPTTPGVTTSQTSHW